MSSLGIPCPKCEQPSKVLDSRPHEIGRTRRYICLSCALRFQTVEFPVSLDARKNRTGPSTEGMIAAKTAADNAMLYIAGLLEAED